MASNFVVADNANSGNDEFYTPYYAIIPLIKYLKDNDIKNILCPFDTQDSRIVKALIFFGFNVKHSHLVTKDFFSYTKEDIGDFDIIVSNPPYSMKFEVFEHLFKLAKPFAMLVGIVGLFESKKRFNLFNNNNFEVMFLDKRVSYHSNFTYDTTEKSPPFSSAWVTSMLLPDRIVFEIIDKKVLSIEDLYSI